MARSSWRWPLLAAALLVLGAAGGYFAGRAQGPSTPVKTTGSAAQDANDLDNPRLLSPDEETELDTAYRAGKEGHYETSRDLFTQFYRKHPQWPQIVMQMAYEDIQAQNYWAAQRVVAGLGSSIGAHLKAESFFLTALFDFREKNYSIAEGALANAVAIDPSSYEYYVLWGDCLRQDGKAIEAGTRFRSALWRNRYEMADDFIQLKVWLCDIATDQENSNGASAAIEAQLASPHPRAGAMFAAAAQALKAGRPADAASLLTRAQAVSDPVLFAVIMQDPSFVQDSRQPALAPFYEQPKRKEAAAQPPTASPAAAPNP